MSNDNPLKNKSSRKVSGGAWGHNPDLLRAAVRFWYDPDDRSINLGFRIVKAKTNEK